ncbi:FAD-dependent oxidoreductase [bacterium]|nr:MAG: FAD-dependent oxidoreductase [bacterium]
MALAQTSRVSDSPRRYQDVSYWLSSAGPLAPRPPLDGSIRADVAILGAGFTGLWTAIELLRREPGLKVVILEREIAGFGASGRNGGWCTADLNASLTLLTRRFGAAGARAVQQAMYGAVDEVGRAAAEEGIDADFDKAGVLMLARGRHQVPAVEAAYREYAEAGFGDRYQLLDQAACAERVAVDRAEAGLYSADGAVVHPGKLVRGLAEAVERRGGIIHEKTAVTRYTTGARPSLVTDRGTVSADVVVLAGEAYLTELPPLHRRLLPIYSLIVMTEPVSDSQLAEIGWRRRLCLASMRLTIDYLSRTQDGRILFGGRGAPYNFGSAIKPQTERHAPTHAMLRSMFADWFPSLASVPFSHAWGGVLGMPRDWIPSFSYDRGQGVAIAGGYTGHGVATSNLAGRVLADLITGRRTELTELPLVGHRSPTWEPEPIRWLGARIVQTGLARVDGRAERSDRPPTGRSLAERLSRH